MKHVRIINVLGYCDNFLPGHHGATQHPGVGHPLRHAFLQVKSSKSLLLPCIVQASNPALVVGLK